MHTQILAIFDMRGALLKRCNLRYYKQHEQVIKNSSLAAQDLYFSGDLADYDSYTLSTLLHDNIYATLHADYCVPYNCTDSRCVNSGLVLDLARALRSDVQSGILNTDGKIIAPNRLTQSQILQVFHNSEDSGIPVTALTRMSPQTRAVFIKEYSKTK